LLDLEAWNDLVPGVNWKEMLRDGDDKDTLAALRLNQSVGPGKRTPRYGENVNRWLSPISSFLDILAHKKEEA